MPVVCVESPGWLENEEKKGKADGSLLEIAGHTALVSQTKRSRMSHLQFHAGPRVSLLASASPTSLHLSLPRYSHLDEMAS